MVSRRILRFRKLFNLVLAHNQNPYVFCYTAVYEKRTNINLITWHLATKGVMCGKFTVRNRSPLILLIIMVPPQGQFSVKFPYILTTEKATAEK